MKQLITNKLLKLICMLVVLTGMYACGGGNEDNTSPNTAPQVSILSPAAKNYITTDVISFRGEGNDTEDGKLPADSLVWMSDIQGELARTDSFEEKLEPGEHTISLSGTDSQGSKGSQSITIIVSAEPSSKLPDNSDKNGNEKNPKEEEKKKVTINNISNLFIASPAEGEYEYGKKLSFIAGGAESENELIGVSIVWVSSLDGEIGIKESFSKILSTGDHVVTLTVTANDGNSVVKTVAIRIKEQNTPTPNETGAEPPVEETPTIVDPQVFLTAPQSGTGFTVGTSTIFKGYAYDSDGKSLNDDQLRWTSNISGDLGGGRSITKDWSSDDVGIHLITLTSTDDAGNSASQNILVTVSELDKVVHVSGVVINSRNTGGAGLADVLVKVANLETKTDSEGNYALNNIPFPSDNKLVVKFSKLNFTSVQKSIDVLTEKTYNVTAALMLYHYSNEHDFTNIVNVEVPGANGESPSVKINFPFGAFETKPELNVSVVAANVTPEDIFEYFPGEFLGTLNGSSDKHYPLDIFAFAELILTDQSGNPITQFDSPVAISLRLPDVFQAGGEREGEVDVGDNVDWWQYDITAKVWRQEDANPGTAEFDKADIVLDEGVLYVSAKISSAGWWGAAKVISDQACVCVTVVDGNSVVIADAPVIASGESYSNISGPVFTDSSGKACLTTVKKSASESLRERIKIYTSLGSVNIYYDVDEASTEEGDAVTDEIFTPVNSYLELKPEPEPVGCVSLSRSLIVAQDGTVSGKLVKQNGEVVSGYRIYSSLGKSVLTANDGTFSFLAPLNQFFTIWAVGVPSVNVTIPSSDKLILPDLVLANRAPVINALEKDSVGIIANNGRVSLFVNATDPDGDELSYTWSRVAGLGKLETSIGEPQAIWTAPSLDVGFDIIAVTVSDGAQSVRREVYITWGVPWSETGFKMQFRSDKKANMASSGIKVILYNEDNKTYEPENVITSDKAGVVDFSHIDQTRGTITIDISSPFSRSIITYVDVPLISFVYYLNPADDICNGKKKDISVNLVADDAYHSWSLLPVDAHGSAGGNMKLVGKCVDHFQNVLAYTSKQGVMNGYGYTLDQDLQSGENVNVQLDIAVDRKPEQLTFHSNNVDEWQISTLKVDALKNNQIFPLAYDHGGEPVSSIFYPTEFPADNYSVFAQFISEADIGLEIRTRKFYNTLALDNVIDVPDINFDYVHFEAADGVSKDRFLWQTSGEQINDLIRMDIYQLSVSNIPTFWTVWLPANNTAGDASSWIPIDVPNPIFPVPRKLLQFKVDIFALDVPSVDSHDDIWQAMSTGNTINDVMSGGFSVGKRNIVNGN